MIDPGLPEVALLAVFFGLAACSSGTADNPTGANRIDDSSSESRQSTVHLVVEVRHGGGMEQRPHHVEIQIFSDGLIRSPSGERRVAPSRVQHLVRQIQATGFGGIGQEEFNRQLRAAGELDIALNGGSGVYTISCKTDGAMHSLHLNQPHLYVNSKVPEARIFNAVLGMIKSFSS